MLASRAESFLSGSIEVFQQPDKPPTCESHGPRSVSVVLCCISSQQATNNKRMVGPEKNYMLWIGDAGRSATCICFNYLASL